MNRTIVAVALALGTSVLAQEAPPKTTKDKDAVTFDEIERGFYMGLTAGPWFLVNPPANTGGVSPFSPGQMVQVEIGMDLGERLSLAAFVTGTANRAGSDYVGKSIPTRPASGDFSSLMPGALVRVNALGFNDSQDVARTWIYVRGGVGYALFFPKDLLPDPAIGIFAGPGVEYYTSLRHFSVGLEVTASLLLSNPMSFGFAITPNLRYAF